MKNFIRAIGFTIIILFGGMDCNAVNYTWNGATSNWNNPANWSPVGLPGASDDVRFSGLSVIDPILPGGLVTVNDFTVDNFGLLGGGFDIAGGILRITGTADINAGTFTNGDFYCLGASSQFDNATFNCPVTVTTGSILLNGATFNNVTSFTKTTASGDVGDGGNTFDTLVTFNHNGTGSFRSGNVDPDIFNDVVIINNNNTSSIILANNSSLNTFADSVYINNTSSGSVYISNGSLADVTISGPVIIDNSGSGLVRFADGNASNITFSDNIIVNNTSGGSIYFGENGGTSTLSSGKTFTIGSGGFASGTLSFKEFTQLGGTAQNLALSGTSIIKIIDNCTFNGNFNISNGTGLLTIADATYNGTFSATCGRITTEGSLFTGNATFQKTSLGTDNSSGNNTFQNLVTFSNTSSGILKMAVTTADTYNDSVSVQNIDGGTISIATGGVAHVFNGLSLTNNGTGKIYLSNSASASTTINGIFSSKITSVGTIYISDPATSSTIFNDNISFESTSTGSIITGNNSGTTSLASGKTISIGSAGFAGGNLILNELTQAGGTTQNITLTSNGSLTIGTNSIFNARLNATTINGTVAITSATFMDTLIVNSFGLTTSSGTFNDYTELNSSGTSTYTSAGGNTFNDLTKISNSGSGNLRFTNATSDAFNDSIVLTNSSSGVLSIGYNSTATFTKVNAINTGSGDIEIGSQSSAVSVHNDALHLNNSSTGNIYLHKESGAISTFNENISLTNTGAGSILFGANGGTGTLVSSKLISPSATGISNGLVSIFGFTQVGITSQTIIPTGSGSLTIGTGSIFNAPTTLTVPGTLTIANSTFNNILTASAARFYSANTTYNGVTTITKNGAGNDYSNGGNTFNDSVNVSMSGSGTLRFAASSGDDYNDFAEFHWTSGQLEPCYTSVNTFNNNVWIDGALTMDIPSTMRLDGNNQTITMTGVDSAYIETLDLSTATGTVTTVGHIILPNATSTVSLGAAILDLNGYELRVHNSINTSITRTSGYILSEQTDNSSKVSWDIGTSTDLFTIPFGNNNGNYIPFHINVTAGDIGTFSISTYGTGSNNLPMPITPDTVKHIFAYFGTQYDNSTSMIDRYWQLDKTGNATSTIRFTYDEDELQIPNIIVESNLRAQRWNSTIEDWDAGVGTPNIVANMVVVTNVSEFSPWVLVDNNSPLPVTWLDFNISKDHNDKAKLDWSTATETNNDFFTIEQSEVIETPTIVDFVDGSGTTNSVKQYSYTDQNTIEGLSYYRVKQTDYDGNSTYTDWKSINIDNNSEALVHMDNNNLVIKTTNNQKGIVTVYSTDGKVLGSGQITETKTTIPVSIEASSILVYSIEFNDGNIQNGKVLKL